MICTNKFDMCKSNNKSIYQHALFLFGMAINGFTMVIIKEKTEPARGPSTLNAMRRPNQSLVSIWDLELRFFLLWSVLSDETEETEGVQN